MRPSLVCHNYSFSLIIHMCVRIAATILVGNRQEISQKCKLYSNWPGTYPIIAFPNFSQICIKNWLVWMSVCLSVCLSACLPVCTDQAHIFCGTSHDPGEGLLMVKIAQRNWVFATNLDFVFPISTLWCKPLMYHTLMILYREIIIWNI